MAVSSLLTNQRITNIQKLITSESQFIKLYCLYGIEWKIILDKRKENSLHVVITQIKKVKNIYIIKISQLNSILREKNYVPPETTKKKLSSG